MKHSLSRALGGATLATCLALVTSCATTPSSGRTESSGAAIRAAQEVGASKVPQAALHLQLAREQAEHARALVASGDSDDRAQAESLLMRAQADAELALALAREDVERSAAQQAVDDVNTMRTQ
jgi:Domain of unknown function (DUF4398)